MNAIKLELRWAVIFTLAMWVWMLIERLFGLHSTRIEEHAIYTNVFAIVAITIYVLALRDKRDRVYGGLISWGQAFKCGLLISVFVALLTPLSQWVIHTLISPHFFTNMADYAVQNGLMEATAAAQYFSLQSYMLQAVLGAFVMGLLTSLVVAFFVRRTPQSPATK